MVEWAFKQLTVDVVMPQAYGDKRRVGVSPLVVTSIGVIDVVWHLHEAMVF